MIGQITTDDVARCLERYPSIGAVTDIIRLTGAFHNTVFRVRTEGGEFYLKVLSTHSAESTEERYRYVSWVMERVRALGVEVPLPIRNRDNLMLTPCGPFPSALSAAVNGEAFEEEDLAHQRAAGRLLGEFHRIVAGATPPGSYWLKELGGYLLEDPSRLDSIPVVPESALIRERFGELVDRSRRLRRELIAAGYERLPRSIVHAEFSGKHLRMKGDRITGLLDFEYVGPEARALDLGRALTSFCDIGPEAASDGLTRAGAFLRGYAETGPGLGERELAALPVLVKTWDFETITFWTRKAIQTGDWAIPFLRLERIEYFLRRVDWWEAHGGECADRLVALLRKQSHESVSG